MMYYWEVGNEALGIRNMERKEKEMGVSYAHSLMVGSKLEVPNGSRERERILLSPAA